MVEVGILAEDEHVELLHGWLTEVSPQGDEHAAAIERLGLWLAQGFADRRFNVRVQMPMRVPDPTSLPEPDIAVTIPSQARRHPTTALLAIEVSVSSRRVDTSVKPALYAAAQVPEYWVVDVSRETVQIYTQPDATRYARRETHAPPDRLEPRAFENEPLDLGMLFAGL